MNVTEVIANSMLVTAPAPVIDYAKSSYKIHFLIEKYCKLKEAAVERDYASDAASNWIVDPKKMTLSHVTSA